MALEFTSLASSSAGCAYRVSCAPAGICPILIDCGLPYKQLQRGLNFKTSELAGCLISHAHGDHCKAAVDLIKAGVECYASYETWKAIGPELTSFHCRQIINIEMKPFMVGIWHVTPFEATHDCPGTLGFVVESTFGHRLLYLTDSAYSKYTFPDLTHIAVECNHSMGILRKNVESGRIDRERFNRAAHTHMSLERLINMLKANDLSKVQEIHLLHLSDDNSDEAAFKAAVERATGIPCRVAAR
jgi:phosphoribosyl 1,2-cyclic phosphodiesterase